VLAALGLNAVEESVYRQILKHGDWGVADLASDLGIAEEQVREALDGLFRLALLRRSADEPGHIHAVDPELGLTHALARQQAELARRQQEIADSQVAIAQLIQDVGRSHPETAATATEIVGIDAVYDRLERLSQETRFEVLTLMPGGPQSAVALEQARHNDERLLRRKVKIRTVGLASIRNDPATMAHARFLTDSGAEFRTSPVLPPRMIVVDRRAALLPLDPSDTRKGALYLTGPGVVASLLALFAQVWEIATPLGAAQDPDREGLSGQERALLKLLAEGRTDEAAAARLGISARTARRMMAGLMERLEACSRFEAGLKAARRGWL
jgi:sugar-specific transcriptional regulator TrmB/DNA-binding CsgD family transcriptional regulator